MEIVFLGDQQAECQQFLQRVFAINDNLILKSLLDQLNLALHQELSRQHHRLHHKRIPRFSNVKELAEHYYSSGHSIPALEAAFLCLAQLAHFVWLV